MGAQIQGFVTRAEWGAAPPSSAPLPMDATIQGGTSHWEGPGMWGSLWELAHHTCAAKVRGIQQYHMSHGWSDIAYSAVVDPHGYVFEGRGLWVRNGANGYGAPNRSHYAFCYLGGIGDPYPLAAMAAMEWCYEWARLFGGAGTDRKCHRDWVQTMCPGDAVCHHTQTFDTTPAPVPIPPAPVPAPPPVPGPTNPVDWLRAVTYAVLVEVQVGPLLRIGSRGGEVRAWQDAINLASGRGIATDGSYGPQTRAATVDFQTYLGLWHDGIVGPQTRGAMADALRRRLG